jgi:hypothetical protein
MCFQNASAERGDILASGKMTHKRLALTIQRALHNSFEQALPGVSEHALGRANQVRTSRLLGSQTDDDGRCIGQRDPRRDGRPPGQRWALQAEDAEQADDTAKEALNTGPFAQLLGGPGGRQARAISRSLGIPGDDGDRSKHRVNPGDETRAPIAGIQADHAWAQPVEAHRRGEQGLGKGRIMAVGGSKEEEQGQAGAAARQVWTR